MDNNVLVLVGAVVVLAVLVVVVMMIRGGDGDMGGPFGFFMKFRTPPQQTAAPTPGNLSDPNADSYSDNMQIGSEAEIIARSSGNPIKADRNLQVSFGGKSSIGGDSTGQKEDKTKQQKTKKQRK